MAARDLGPRADARGGGAAAGGGASAGDGGGGDSRASTERRLPGSGGGRAGSPRREARGRRRVTDGGGSARRAERDSGSRPRPPRARGGRRDAEDGPKATSAPTDAGRASRPSPLKGDGGSGLPKAIRDIVGRVPLWVKFVVAVLGALALVLGAAYSLSRTRARRLRRQREALLEDVGLLQTALLPRLPDRVGGLPVSVAYRPAAGLAAGGDFYDAFELDDDRIAFIVGDVSGHGREALSRTTLCTTRSAPTWRRTSSHARYSG